MAQAATHGEAERDAVQAPRVLSLRRRLALLVSAAIAAAGGRDDSATDILIRGMCTGCCAA